ncbi:MAG: hypothetical protein EZS28_005654, partial [Streblomastix strix]
ANEIIEKRGKEVPISRQQPVTRSFPFDLQRRSSRMKKIEARMKELPRLMAENKQSLSPNFKKVQVLHDTYHYPPGMFGNFDETPIRLSNELSPTQFYTDAFPPSPIIAPPRTANASLVPFVCADGQHLTTFLLWPADKVPPELDPLIARDFQIIANKSGYMNKETLTQQCMPVWIKEIDEKRKCIRPPVYADQHFLMLFDSHSSRGDLDMIRELRLNNIDAVSIVPNSSGVSQPLDLCPNGRLKSVLNKDQGWVAESGAEGYRIELCKRLEEGTAALLFPPTIRQGFELSGYLDGQAENCLKRVPDKPQVPNQVAQSYHPKPRGFALGAKVLTDQHNIDRWQDFIDSKDAKQEEIEEKRKERLKKKKAKQQEKEDLSLEKQVKMIDRKMNKLRNRNSRKRRRIMNETDISDGEEYYQDGCELNIDDEGEEDQTEDFTETEDADPESLNNDETNVEDESSEEENLLNNVPKKRKRNSPIIIDDDDLSPKKCTVNKKRTSKASKEAMQSLETESRWRQYKK